jgi:hypothetical protein
MVMCPDVPAPWSTWTFWQNSSTGTVSGVSGASSIDLDYFNGTLAQLAKLGVAGGADAGPPPDTGTAVDSGGSGKDGTTPPPRDGGHDAGAPPGDAGKISHQSDASSDGGGGSGGSTFDHRAGGCSLGAGHSREDERPLALALLLPLLASASRRRGRVATGARGD